MRETASCGAWEKVECQKNVSNDSRKQSCFEDQSESFYKGFHALTKVLTMSSFISIDEEEGVTRIDETSAMRAVRDMNALTVSSNQETVS